MATVHGYRSPFARDRLQGTYRSGNGREPLEASNEDNRSDDALPDTALSSARQFLCDEDEDATQRSENKQLGDDEQPSDKERSSGDEQSASKSLYQPLDGTARAIRLLGIYPDSLRHGPARLACKIARFTLEDAPAYSAISYAWGDIQDRHYIGINGSKVSVPAQAEEALWHLHSHGVIDEAGMSYFWIDALCINQGDLEVRSNQVSIMADIYSNAERVLVYLGAPFHGSREAVDIITKVADDLRSRYDTTASLEASLTFYNESRYMPLGEDALTMLSDFFASRWLTRLWIIQEVALSKRAFAYIGSGGLNFWNVVIVARLLAKMEYQVVMYRTLSNRLTRGIEYCQALYRLRYSEACSVDMEHDGQCVIGVCYPGLTLDWLLENSHNHQNSEPRDKVYAILGLCKPEVAKLIRPDYGKSLHHLYAETTKMAFLEVGDFRSMRWARSLGNKPTKWYRDTGWPTWVPLWHKSYDDRSNPSALPCWPFASTSLMNNRDLLVQTDNTILRCSATVVGHVSTISSPCLTLPSTDPIDDVAKHVLRCIEELCPSETNDRTHPETASWITRFGLTLAAGYYPFAEPEEDMGEAHFGAFLKDTPKAYLCSRLSAMARSKLLFGRGEASRYLLQVRIHSRCRSVFFTTEGHVGLGPQHMKESDIVCVPSGSSFPWVIRREGTYHLFIGQCYVYGVMEDYTEGKYDKAPHQIFEIH